ncbi:hypothetical protein CHKEEEPN_3088 [Methylorubrum podarium]|jgi:hypothetical protein|nr:hypothetical protein CHKEEEPN_3088 [Methylorubrum podarium]
MRPGTRLLLAALAAGVIPSTAMSQNVIILDENSAQVPGIDSGEMAPVSARNLVTPDGVAYRVDVFGSSPGSRMVVAQNLVTQNGTAPIPNVNDCTFIRDPIALRDCINLYEGQRLGPGPRISSTVQTQLITDKALIEAAGPIPASGRVQSGRSQERASPPNLRGTNAAYIDQVAPSR